MRRPRLTGISVSASVILSLCLLSPAASLHGGYQLAAVGSFYTMQVPLRRVSANEWRGTPVIIASSNPEFYPLGEVLDQVTVRVTSPGRVSANWASIDDTQDEGTCSGSQMRINNVIANRK